LALSDDEEGGDGDVEDELPDESDDGDDGAEGEAVELVEESELAAGFAAGELLRLSVL
jgi:hypothetical protein